GHGIGLGDLSAKDEAYRRYGCLQNNACSSRRRRTIKDKEMGGGYEMTTGPNTRVSFNDSSTMTGD
ncbi:MAG: hypothetical protein ABI945_08535, partial [Nitrospirales bacterium]